MHLVSHMKQHLLQHCQMQSTTGRMQLACYPDGMLFGSTLPQLNLLEATLAAGFVSNPVVLGVHVEPVVAQYCIRKPLC